MAIVGPDGVGKTTLATELLKAWPAERRYFHFRPPVRGQMPQEPPPAEEFVASKPNQNGSRALGWVRIARSLILFTAGHLFAVRPALRRGALVVGDRWAYGYLAAPDQLNFYGPAWLARWVISVLPQPDLVVCLTAPSNVVVARKPELTAKQVEDEDRRWQSIPARAKTVLSALEPPETLAAKVRELL